MYRNVTLLALILSFLFAGCIGYKVVPLKGTYTDGNFEAYSDKSINEVWDNIFDFFARSGITIRIIDKSSGLIISGTTALKWSYENPKGVLYHPDAWVAVFKTIDPNSKKPIGLVSVTGEWNIRIKPQGERTLINVNLVSPSYTSVALERNNTVFKKGEIQSTGVFEKLIYDKIK
jgi:hypothetical protein